LHGLEKEERKKVTLLVDRFEQNPIVRPEMLAAGDGDNINGPCLIRAPWWLEKPLGKYYLYFAHHGGTYIRLAYAQELGGPWHVHEPGTLRLEQAPGCRGHVASPEVVIDDEQRRIVMYFHGPARDRDGQWTFVATSGDGLHFEASAEPLTPFYMRVFRWKGTLYGMCKGGLLYRSANGMTAFEEGHCPLSGGRQGEALFNQSGDVRHVAVDPRGDGLWVYASRIGDAPERIVRCRIQLTDDWMQWRGAEFEEVLAPERDYEGAALTVKPSKAGAAHGPEHAVRDPAIFVEDGRTYLLYSVAGESGLAIAELRLPRH
jgi:hypothetical protein